VDVSGEVADLLGSDEPSVRWKVRTQVLGEDMGSRAVRRLREEVRRSPRVQRLLDGVEGRPVAAYAKWGGAHWVLLALADLGHPEGDERLLPLRDQVLRTWLATRYLREYDDTGSPADRYRAAVPVSQGRHRRCASQHGGALLAVVRLGIDDGRAARLAGLLQHWQWPDGGWNCDRRSEARSSSVHETLLTMRGLHAFGSATSDRPATAAADRAAEVFLSRRVVFRRSDPARLGSRSWAELRYPAYWHHGLLAGLTGLAETGHLRDDRCADALDLLLGKRCEGGGWPAEGRWYRDPSAAPRTGADLVTWGGASRRRPNPWVTAGVLAVLAAAGRLDGTGRTGRRGG
jgi:hypothetical protein